VERLAGATRATGPELRRDNVSAPVGSGGALARPASCGALFWAFTRLALQGFGGVLPVAQRELVERLGWLDKAQFLEMLSLAQVLPGPNVVNLSLMVGDRFFGWRGALAALAGMMLFPLLIVLLLAAAAGSLRDVPAVVGALRGMAVVAAGLVAATAIKLASGLRQHPFGRLGAGALVLLTVLAIAALRWPLVPVLLGLGSAAMALAAWRLGR
jgi:chromate transporter